MDFATKDTWRQGSSRSRSNAKFGTIYLVVFNVRVAGNEVSTRTRSEGMRGRH